LRCWHEEANNLDIWQNLRLAIANSTETYIQLDANQSPFNVGRAIKLPGFTVEQLQNLANIAGLPLNDDNNRFLADLIPIVAGHPYLSRLAIEARVRGETNILENASTQGGIYAAHLRHHWDNLQKQPELLTAMLQVVNSVVGTRLEPITAYKLESMGLINLEGDLAQPSCQLYQQYFGEEQANFD
jgi:hypothetical protein